MGEIEVIVQRSGDPDAAGLDTSVFEGGVLNEVRLLSILKIQGDIVAKLGLIAPNWCVLSGQR